jgi:hypothetical protein
MFEFAESPDYTAVIKTGPNSLEWAPIFLDTNDIPFVRQRGELVPLSGVDAFLRYEPIRKRKPLYDTATLEVLT